MKIHEMHEKGEVLLYLVEADNCREQYLEEFNELKLDLENDNFRRRDYRTLERLLLVFIVARVWTHIS